MTYKIGDVIAGKYTVTRDFDSANSGQCQWGFASYNGEEFFIKKFLNPVYPGDLAPGSEKSIQKRRDRCHAFEKKQLAIQKALSACGRGGLVVVTVDFFKYGDEYGQHYFKVSQKVDTSSLSTKVYTLERKTRLFIMITAAGALKILHQKGIIHLDLKPDNILIQEWEDKYAAKIIDFDSSILEGEIVPVEFLVGDPVYYSPEFAKHIATGGETSAPTKKSDIFALGLIFSQYWTGQFPDYYGHTYAHEAALKEYKLTITIPTDDKSSRLKGTLLKPKQSNILDTGVENLIEKMLLLYPDDRPSIEKVHQTLLDLYHKGRLAPDEPIKKLRIFPIDK